MKQNKTKQHKQKETNNNTNMNITDLYTDIGWIHDADLKIPPIITPPTICCKSFFVSLSILWQFFCTFQLLPRGLLCGAGLRNWLDTYAQTHSGQLPP